MHSSPVPLIARLPKTLSALFLASKREYCAPGRVATLPPSLPREPRAGGRRGREAEPGSSVRVSGSSGWRGMEDKPATMRASALSLSLPPAPSFLRPLEIISYNTGII